MDIPSLIPEQEALLRWLEKQAQPVSLSEMRQAQAPGYDRRRVQGLKKAGYAAKTMKSENDGWVEAYMITDLGRAALLESDQQRQARADQAADKRAERTAQKDIAIRAAVVGAIAAAAASLLFPKMLDLIPEFIDLFTKF